MGAMQSLRDVLLSARYLASVSGGGYTAAAFQLALTGAGTEKVEELGEVERDPISALMPGSVDEDRVRRHASYLANSPASMLMALGVLARTVVLSITVLYGPAVLVGLLVGQWYARVPLVEGVGVERGYDLSRDPQLPDVRPESWYLLAGLVLLAFAAYAVSVVMSGFQLEPDGTTERVAKFFRELGGGITGFTLLVALLAVGLPFAVYAAASVLHDRAGEVSLGAPLGALLLAYGTTIMAIGRQKKVRTRVRGLFKRGAPVASVPSGALQLLLVMVALLVLAVGWLLLAGGVAAVEPRLGDGERWVIVIFFVGGLGFLGGILDQTVLSLHPFYRRRLAGAFAARRITKGGHSFANGYAFTERTTLSDYAKRIEIVGEDGRTKFELPESVYVAAANLTGEELAALNAVSFTFTADWVGGPDIGYVRTEDPAAHRPAAAGQGPHPAGSGRDLGGGGRVVDGPVGPLVRHPAGRHRRPPGHLAAQPQSRLPLAEGDRREGLDDVGPAEGPTAALPAARGPGHPLDPGPDAAGHRRRALREPRADRALPAAVRRHLLHRRQRRRTADGLHPGQRRHPRLRGARRRGAATHGRVAAGSRFR